MRKTVTKSETNSKHEIQITETLIVMNVLNFRHLDFGFVSDFVIRIWLRLDKRASLEFTVLCQRRRQPTLLLTAIDYRELILHRRKSCRRALCNRQCVLRGQRRDLPSWAALG